MSTAYMAPRLASFAVHLVLLIGVSICGSSAQPLEVEQATREVIIKLDMADLQTLLSRKNSLLLFVHYEGHCATIKSKNIRTS